jgi:predicted secreted protein
MMATLTPLTDSKALKVDRGQGADIQKLSDNSDTSWSWDIKGRQAGSPQLFLDLKYEVSQEEEFRSLPDSPVYDEKIKVTSPAPEPPWWRRIFERISGFFGA